MLAQNAKFMRSVNGWRSKYRQYHTTFLK